jgi:N-acetylglucosaminyl-diphospho-decaprenol L-rhamnosyltransferase
MLRDRISVVMITRNRAGAIHTALRQLLDLPEKPRILVVDNNSTDHTVDTVRCLDRSIEVVPLRRNLGGAGRNVGVRLAHTPYVAFSDDDSWWAPGALSRAVERLDSFPRLGLLAARILVGQQRELDPVSHLMATGPLTSDDDGGRAAGVPIVSFVACGAIVRREAFLQAGGFGSRFGVGGEEEVLAMDLMRHGWQLAYADDIIAFHHPSAIRNLAKRQRHQVRNALWTVWLRRPASSAIASTWRIASDSLKDAPCRLGILDALRGLPWVLRARDPIPHSIDRRVRIAETLFYARRRT